MAATERGKTGEMQSTWRNRIAPKLHAPGASARPATPTDEATRNQTMVRRSPTISPSRGAMKEPRAAAAPVAKRSRPPTSRVMGGLTPRRGRTWGSMAVRKKICIEPESTRRHTVATSRTEAVGGRSCSARAIGWYGVPHHLPQRHARLNGSDAAPHVAAGAPRHDEGKGGDGAHES